jgi:hypothetical protein
LIHFNAEIKLVDRNHQQFTAFTYRSKSEAAMVSALIALFTYQTWGKYYAFPLTREDLNLWPSRIEEYAKIKLIQNVIKPFQDTNEYAGK